MAHSPFLSSPDNHSSFPVPAASLLVIVRQPTENAGKKSKHEKENDMHYQSQRDRFLNTSAACKLEKGWQGQREDVWVMDYNGDILNRCRRGNDFKSNGVVI